MKMKMKRNKLIAFLILLLAVTVMVYAGGQLSETNKSYRESSAAYEDIKDRVRINQTAGLRIDPQPNILSELSELSKTAQPSMDMEDPPETTAEVYIPKLEIDFETLKSFSKDAAAWLYSPDTAIDYPVMKASDYSYYLNRLPDGTKNASGSLFIDYNCASDFSGQLTVIYGHHMKSGSMFGSLKKYKEQAYYEKHPFMYLYTEQGNYRIDLLYGCVIGAGQWINRGFIYAENIEELLAYAEKNTTFKKNNTERVRSLYTEKDRLIVLSTCSYEFDGARYVVIGTLNKA